MFKNLTGSLSTFLEAITPVDNSDNSKNETLPDDPTKPGVDVGAEKSSEQGEVKGEATTDDTAKPDAGDKKGEGNAVPKVGDESKVAEGDDPSSETQGDTLHNIQTDIDEVSAKAMKAAKEWGSYLYTFGMTASQHCTTAAIQLKDAVQDKTIIGDFSAENKKFVTENQEKKRLNEAAVAPWVGFDEEQSMRKQIIALSQDKRNFIRNPPEGVTFHFEFTSSYPVAMAILDVDPMLKKMRFDLVPKVIKEEVFWRNYFYRVSLVKQSTQLASMATESSIGSSKNTPTKPEPRVIESPDITELRTNLTESLSHDQDEFISDTFNDLEDTVEDDDDVTDATEEEPEWEKELAAELNEFEIVIDENTDGLDEDLEKEILQEMKEQEESKK